MAESAPQQVSPRLAWTRAETMVLAILLAATFLCYLPALGYDFVYDDGLLILGNPQLRSWRFAPLFFREHFIAPVFPHAPANYYRPLLLLWMLLNRQVWGVSAAGWHLAALALHLGVTAGVYLVARRILGDRFSAGIAAGVFALHPVHVECVAWVMGMTESFGAIFFVAALLCYLRARDSVPASRPWFGTSVFLFACALLAKENMIVLPAVLAAWEFFLAPSRDAATHVGALFRRGLRSVLPVIPYFLVAAVYLGVRVVVLGALSRAATALPLATQLATQPVVVSRYLILLIWPEGLSAFYDVPYVPSFSAHGVLVPLVGDLVGLLALALWATKSPRVGFAAVWLLAPLLPLLNLTVFPPGEIVHDRYLYLSSIGFALLAGLLLAGIPERVAPARRGLSPRAAAGAVLLASLGALTCYYRGFWKNNMALFSRGAAMAPLNDTAANNLGNEFVKRGDYPDAVAIYQKILARHPDLVMSIYNLGWCEYRLGRLDEAARSLGRAVALSPEDPVGHMYLGITYLKMGRVSEAEGEVRRAIALAPKGLGFHLALGEILKARGDLEGALAEFRAELENHPGEAPAEAEARQLEERRRK